IERDPYSDSALTSAALCHLQLHVSGWSTDLHRDQAEGLSLARRALQVAGDDPGVLAFSGDVLAYFGENIAIELIDRALVLNPSFAQGWYFSGWLRLWGAGQPELAISHFETSLRLSPHAVRAQTFLGIGVGYFFAQRFEDAIAMLL